MSCENLSVMQAVEFVQLTSSLKKLV